MSVLYAFRDAFGIKDLIEDTKLTFRGKGYEYRLFDPSDPTALAHPESGARVARMMEGLRYQRGGKGKYWIPKPTSRTGLLSAPGPSSHTRTLSPGRAERGETRKWYGEDQGFLEEIEIDEEDEKLFVNARTMEFGDYNYPVITAYEPRWNRRMRMDQTGCITTTSTNQALLRPQKGKAKQSRTSHFPPHVSPPSPSNLADRPGVIDLVVKDTEAENVERVRARKEGGPGWNQVRPKKFIRKYPDSEAGEIAQNFPFLNAPPIHDAREHRTDTSNTVNTTITPDGHADESGEHPSDARSPLLDLDTNEIDFWKAAAAPKDKGGNVMPGRTVSYDNLIDEDADVWS